MSKRNKYPLLSELSYDQKCNLAWRIDKYTGTGLLTAARIARAECGDMPINEALEMCEMTSRQAKLHATRTLQYGTPQYKFV
jgi:hypothetical protein